MKQFSSAVIEKIEYYVYILINPEDKQIFYIGKGKGNRVFSHVNGAIKGEKLSDKVNLIQKINSRGLQVEHYIVRHGLTEKESLEVEGALIDFYGKSNLTNIVLGHKSSERGIMDIDEININYDATDVEIEDDVILININNLYYFGIPKNELYEATRKSWKANIKRASKAKYAFCHYHGIIRGVYEINNWYDSIENPGRIEFNGKAANEDTQEKYLHKSIKKYFKQGSQNPIKYVNV